MASSYSNQFLGIESKYESSKVIIIPAPFEASTSYQKGTANGPKALICASQEMELYDIELNVSIDTIGIHTLKPLNFSKKSAKEACHILTETTQKILKDKKWPVMLGGEHTISYGIFKALFEKYPNLSIFHIDAHADMRKAYQDNPYSHASILYLIRESCPQTVSIGIRNVSEEEANYIQKNNVIVYYDHEIQKTGIDMEKILNQLTDQVYLTIDVDGFSPSLVPSTGTPEPGGLGWYDGIAILKKLFKGKEIMGMDVVEHMPIKNLVHGDFSVAKLIYKCIGYKYFQG